MAFLAACPQLDALIGIAAAGVVSSPVDRHIFISNISLYVRAVRPLHLQENGNARTNSVSAFDLWRASDLDENLSSSRGWSVECDCDCIWDFLGIAFGIHRYLPPLTLASSGKIPRPDLVQVDQVSPGLPVRARKAAYRLSDVAREVW